MSISNYPTGFAQGVVIRGVPLLQTHPGKVFWVGNSATLLQGEKGASNVSNSGTYLQPFATIDFAVGQCAANRGDIIVVRPNHTETVTAAAGLALDVAGIAVIGLGTGSNRPTVNLTTSTAATVTISAANVVVSNILFTGGIDAIASVIVVSAADVSIVNCEVRDVTGGIVLGILTTAAANRLLVKDFFFNGIGVTEENGAAIAIVGGSRITIDGFRATGIFTVGAIDIRTTATTQLVVQNARLNQLHATNNIFIIDTVTGSSGQIGPNIYVQLAEHAANVTEVVTGATFVVFDDVYVVNLVNEKAMLINWTATTDA